MRQAVATSLFASLGVAIILVAWLKPRYPSSPVEGLVLVFLLQAGAFAGSRWLAPQRGASFVKALLSAALFSLVVIFFLQPSVAVAFDALFLTLTFVELAALALAGFVARPGARGE